MEEYRIAMKPLKKFDEMSLEERKQNSLKVIHMGFPMYYYDEENILWGFWSIIANLFPSIEYDYNLKPHFIILTYKGSYWRALYKFLLGQELD